MEPHYKSLNQQIAMVASSTTRVTSKYHLADILEYAARDVGALANRFSCVELCQCNLNLSYHFNLLDNSVSIHDSVVTDLNSGDLRVPIICVNSIFFKDNKLYPYHESVYHSMPLCLWLCHSLCYMLPSVSIITTCAGVVYEYTRSYPYNIIVIGPSIIVNESSARDHNYDYHYGCVSNSM